MIIADGLFGQNDLPVEINCKHFKTVRIATEIVHTPAMVVLSHFKGHEAAGFGGAIKNLGHGLRFPARQGRPARLPCERQPGEVRRLRHLR